MRGLVQQLRVTARVLAKSPGYAAATVVILALGIGANAAIFSIVRTVLLRPLPFAEAERIVRVWETYSNGRGRGSVSLPNFRDWRAEAAAFEEMAAHWLTSRNLQGVEQPERLQVLESTASLFPLLGVRPALGRFFSEAEEQPGGEPTVVLTDSLWRRRFAADPAVVGGVVTLDGTAHRVVGVTPASFRYPIYGAGVDAYLPHRASADGAGRGHHYLTVLGRLRPGIGPAGAQEQLAQVAARLEREYPDAQTGRGVELRSLAEAVRGPVREPLLLLLAAVGVVLAIACANLVGLALARAAARQREASIRSALGASRGHLVREASREALLLAVAGIAVGGVLAGLILEALSSWASQTLPHLGPLELDGTVFALLVALGVGTSGLAALVPALSLARRNLARELVATSPRSTGGVDRQRARRFIVTVQLALSVTLLVGAGLLLRTFHRLQSTAPGFERIGVLTLHLTPSQGRYDDASVATQLLRPILERLRALPTVEAAGALSILPIQNWGNNSSYTIEGLEAPPAGDEWWVETRVGSPGAFEALGIPLRQGRTLRESDGETGGEPGAPLPAVVNEAFVRRHFPDGKALERRVRFDETTIATIVGVVGDTRQGGLDAEPLPELTFAYNDPRFADTLLYDTVLVVRGTGSPAALTPAVRAAIAAVDPAQPLHTVRTLDEVVWESLADRRFTLALVAAFALVAVALAGTGLYALIAYLVAQRTREVGVRMALGATAREVSRWVLGEGIALAGAGVALGVVGGWAASRLVASQLHAVHPLDPLTWIVVLAFLVLVTLAACVAPALRAARVDPIHVLRQE